MVTILVYCTHNIMTSTYYGNAFYRTITQRRIIVIVIAIHTHMLKNIVTILLIIVSAVIIYKLKFCVRIEFFNIVKLIETCSFVFQKTMIF